MFGKVFDIQMTRTVLVLFSPTRVREHKSLSSPGTRFGCTTEQREKSSSFANRIAQFVESIKGILPLPSLSLMIFRSALMLEVVLLHKGLHSSAKYVNLLMLG